MAIITIQEYRDFIGHEGTKVDPRLDSLILAVSSAIELYLGYKLDETATASILTISRRQDYYLDSTGATVTGITYDRPYPYKEETPFTLTEDMYFVESDTGRVTIFYPEMEERGVLKVTYSQTGTSTLEDIKLAAKLLTRYYYKDEYNVQSINAAGQSVSFITGKNFPPHVRTLLDLHRVL